MTAKTSAISRSGIEIGRGRAADEQPVAELADDRGDGARIDRGMHATRPPWPRSNAATNCSIRLRSNSACSAATAGLRVASAQISRQSFALSGDASSKCRRPSARKAVRKSLAAVAQLAEFPAEIGAVALAEAGDQRVLGGEIAIEIAGAHAGLRRHVLHGRAVEAGAAEAALRRVQDLRPAVRRRLLTVPAQGCVAHSHVLSKS